MKVMLVNGKLTGLKSVDLEFCEHCVYDKQRRVNFKRGHRQPNLHKLELVHIDY